MNRIVTIVEGHGEQLALPGLLRRIAGDLGCYAAVPEPIRIGKDKLLKAGELERAVKLAALQADPGDGILVLLDANGDCPAQLASELLGRARGPAREREIRIVLAKREFECWFIAAAESIAGHRGLRADLNSPPDPEAIGGAKRWLARHIVGSRSYRETRDQPALVEIFDLGMARERAPSFDKFVRDVESLLRNE